MEQQNADPTQPPFLGLPEGKEDGGLLNDPRFPSERRAYVDRDPTAAEMHWWVQCAECVIPPEIAARLHQQIKSLMASRTSEFPYIQWKTSRGLRDPGLPEYDEHGNPTWDPAIREILNELNSAQREYLQGRATA